jgi:hypothetical protein
MPASTLPGPHSTHVAQAARGQRAHHLHPPHGAEGLPVQRVAYRLRIRGRSHVDVVDDRHDRCRDGHRSQPFLQAVGGGLHQAGVERRGDSQRQSALGAAGLEQLAGGVSTPALVPAITVCLGSLKLTASTTSPLAARRIGAACLHGLGVQAEDGGHGTHPHRHRVLHGLGAQAHQGQRVGQRQRAGSHQGGVLAQRMTGHGSRHGRPRPRQAR